MKSNANIKNLSVMGAKDKGISIGENSSIIVKNSTFDKNFIGIAVKDNSKATIEDSNFKENYYQLASYAKNWRYSGGGTVSIKNSNFLSKSNRFSVLSEPGDEEDKKKKELNQNSFINISDSKIEGEIFKEGNNILLN